MFTKRKAAGCGSQPVGLHCGQRAACGDKAVHFIAATKMRSKHQSSQALWGPSTKSHLSKVPLPANSTKLHTTPVSPGPSEISPNIPEATTALSFVLTLLLHRNSGLQEEVHRQRGSQPVVAECRQSRDTGMLVPALSLWPLSLRSLVSKLAHKQGFERFPSAKTGCAVPVLYRKSITENNKLPITRACA